MGEGMEAGRGGGGGGGGGVAGRVEIDTSAPFRSVKEAVVLFGERVLVGEVYANRRLNEIRSAANKNESDRARLGSVIAELEETRQDLEEANEERLKMAQSLNSLEEELEKTKWELTQLKSTERDQKKPLAKDIIEIEDVKFVESADSASPVLLKSNSVNKIDEFQKKRSVTFACPPSVAPEEPRVVLLQRQCSADGESAPVKKTKKPIVPVFISALFAKKKKKKEMDHQFDSFPTRGL